MHVLDMGDKKKNPDLTSGDENYEMKNELVGVNR